MPINFDNLFSFMSQTDISGKHMGFVEYDPQAKTITVVNGDLETKVLDSDKVLVQLLSQALGGNDVYDRDGNTISIQ